MGATCKTRLVNTIRFIIGAGFTSLCPSDKCLEFVQKCPLSRSALCIYLDKVLNWVGCLWMEIYYATCSSPERNLISFPLSFSCFGRNVENKINCDFCNGKQTFCVPGMFFLVNLLTISYISIGGIWIQLLCFCFIPKMSVEFSIYYTFSK